MRRLRSFVIAVIVSLPMLSDYSKQLRSIVRCREHQIAATPMLRTYIYADRRDFRDHAPDVSIKDFKAGPWP
jgi:hypothetical protein